MVEQDRERDEWVARGWLIHGMTQGTGSEAAASRVGAGVARAETAWARRDHVVRAAPPGLPLVLSYKAACACPDLPKQAGGPLFRRTPDFSDRGPVLIRPLSRPKYDSFACRCDTYVANSGLSDVLAAVMGTQKAAIAIAPVPRRVVI